TASADKLIILWKSGKKVRTLSGSTDCVRGLAIAPGTGFISCGNDSTLRIWTREGDCIQELYGHTSFVYSVTSLPTGEFFSSGEDRTVRVWKGWYKRETSKWLRSHDQPIRFRQTENASRPSFIHVLPSGALPRCPTAIS